MHSIGSSRRLVRDNLVVNVLSQINQTIQQAEGGMNWNYRIFLISVLELYQGHASPSVLLTRVYCS